MMEQKDIHALYRILESVLLTDMNGLCETIPESPESDARGLWMQLVIPRALVRY